MQWADPECTMALDFVFAVGWSRMYNGIGLSTARGSGTNGFVQRNLSSVKRTKDRVDYRTEEDVARLEKQLNRQPNAEILSHDRKRRVELKCMEMHELMEEQGWVSTLSLILCFFLNPFTPIPNRAFCHRFTTSQFQATFWETQGILIIWSKKTCDDVEACLQMVPFSLYFGLNNNESVRKAQNTLIII